MSNFNPYLQPALGGETDKKGDPASIETYDSPRLMTWQTRAAAPTDYEQKLGDALEALFAREVYDLDGIVAGLNDRGLADPVGQPWTKPSFKAAMKRLGDGLSAS